MRSFYPVTDIAARLVSLCWSQRLIENGIAGVHYVVFGRLSDLSHFDFSIVGQAEIDMQSFRRDKRACSALPHSFEHFNRMVFCSWHSQSRSRHWAIGTDTLP
jgi:hypothetical protein